MGSRGCFALMCLVFLVAATGSSARDTASTASALRLLPTEEEASIVQTQKRNRPSETHADLRERQMLAWIILLMKDGRAAR